MTERLLGRAKTSGRVDDNIDTIKLRLKTFENQTLPILDKYSDRIKKVKLITLLILSPREVVRTYVSTNSYQDPNACFLWPLIITNEAFSISLI